MPQLDFFTFPHQYLVASVCFLGMYYFNLIFFFDRIKYLQLNKIFSLNSSVSSRIIVLGDYILILTDLFKFEEDIFKIFKKKNRKLTRKFFLKKINSILESQLSVDSLNLNLFFLFLVFFFFLKNFLIFNAEKLMLIYFVIIAGCIILILRNFINNLLQIDFNKILFLIVQIEAEGDRALSFLKEYLVKLQENLICTQLEFLLLKSLEVQLI